jgi:hypothetical protein
VDELEVELDEAAGVVAEPDELEPFAADEPPEDDSLLPEDDPFEPLDPFEEDADDPDPDADRLSVR